MKRIVLLFALAVISSNGLSAAGFEKDKLNVGIMPALSLPLGGFKDDFKSSMALGIAAEYSIKEDLRVGLESAYVFKHEAKNLDWNIKIISITPMIKKIWAQEKYSFYSVAGAGLYHWMTPSLNLGFITVPSDSATSLGFNLGGGLSYDLKNNLMVGADIRWHHLFSSEGDIIKSGEMNILAVGLKLDYKF